MPAYLFWGEEEFNIENAVLDLRNKLLDPNWAALNHKVLYNPEISELIESLQTLPMAFGNILIEVRDASLFLRGGKKAPSDKIMAKLIDILEHINDNVYLLFVCQLPRDSGKKIDSALKITKAIERVGKIQAFDAFKAYNERELVSWINQAASSKDLQISKDAALVLVQNTGPELRRLDSELDKLKVYISPNKTINTDSVLALCSSHENVFLLADLWLQGNKAKAVLELHKLFEKDHPLKIAATLQTILRRWLKIKIESKSKNAFEISRVVNLHKYVVEKDLEKLSKISVENLIELRNKLNGAEYKIKTGALEAELSLELTIAS